MKGENNKLVGDSIQLIDRLAIFWKVILELSQNTHNDIDFSASSKSSQKAQWECKSKCKLTREASPMEPIMKVIPDLHFPDGTLLDYYQHGSMMGSSPILYVRKETEPRLPDNPEFCLGDLMPKVTEAIDAILPDFTQEGAWELILLEELGEQFNLVWHARYNTLRIIYDMAEFFSGSYFGKKDSCYFDTDDTDRLSEVEKEELLSWDIMPKVKLMTDHALVNYCVFSPFGGFFKVQRKVQFKPELLLLKPCIKKKVPYNCGIYF